MTTRMKLKPLLMIALFYVINFPVWDLLVDHQILGPRWAAFATYTVLFLLSVILFHKDMTAQWQTFKATIRSPRHYLGEIVLWAVVGTLLTSDFIYVFSQWFAIDFIPGNQENVNDMVSELPAVLSILMMSVYAPVIEEVTFRHAFIGWVDKKDKLLLAIMTVLSVIAFDMIHVMKLPEFWYYLPMSLLLTAVYWRFKRNVWGSILFHALFNTGGYILIALGIIG